VLQTLEPEVVACMCNYSRENEERRGALSRCPSLGSFGKNDASCRNGGCATAPIDQKGGGWVAKFLG